MSPSVGSSRAEDPRHFAADDCPSQSRRAAPMTGSGSVRYAVRLPRGHWFRWATSQLRTHLPCVSASYLTQNLECEKSGSSGVRIPPIALSTPGQRRLDAGVVGAGPFGPRPPARGTPVPQPGRSTTGRPPRSGRSSSCSQRQKRSTHGHPPGPLPLPARAGYCGGGGLAQALPQTGVL